MSTETTVLTESQQKILEFITGYVEKHEVPPTIREIQKGAGISSTSMVSYHLKALERAQLLNRYERQSRGVVINNPKKIISSNMVSTVVSVDIELAPRPAGRTRRFSLTFLC